MLETDAVPSIDWLTLLDERVAYDWLTALLDGKVTEIELNPTGEQTNHLWQLYWGQRMGVRLYGNAALYFEYPFFWTGHDNSAVEYPLLRWPCQLQPPRPGSPAWILSSGSQVEPEVNYEWTEWARTRIPDVDWQERLQAISKATNKHEAFQAFTESLAAVPDWQINSIQPALLNQQNAILFKTDMPNGGLLWQAELKLDVVSWQKGDANASLNEQEVTSWFGTAVHSRTPSEQGLQSGLQQYDSLVWHTKADLGHSLMQLVKVVETLRLQDASCLIVAKDRYTLDKMAELFAEHGLQDEVFVWQNESVDLPLWTAKVVAFEKQVPTPALIDLAAWRAGAGQLDRQQQHLQGALLETRQEIFGQQRWADILGLYLRASRTQAKALLASQLKAISFAFTEAEFNSIQQSIEQTRPLWRQLPEQQPPVSDLSAAIFIHQSEAEAADFIQQTADRLFTKALPLHQAYVKQQNDYADALQNYYQRYYLQLREGLEKVKATLQDLRTRHGEDVVKSRDATLSLYATFSSKFKAAKQQRNSLKQQLRELETTHLQRNEFEVVWPDIQIYEGWSQLPTFLVDYESELEQWLVGLAQHIQDETLRLNYKTAFQELSASLGIQALEERLEDFIDEVNAVGLYQLPLKSKHLTLLKQQRYLEEIIEKLERSRLLNDSFPIFYAWQKNWFSLTENARKVIQALMRTRAAEWANAFSSWYYNELLTNTHRPQLGDAFREEKKVAELRDQQQNQLVSVIRSQSYPQQKAAVRDLKIAIADSTFSLDSLNPAHGRALAQLAPITLSTPAVARVLAPYFMAGIALQNHRQPFDAITACSKRIYTHPQEVERQALELNSDAVVVQDQDVAPAIGEASTRIEDLQGRYDERTRVNTAEADALLNWLNTLEIGTTKRLPKVIMLCFTTAQRNHILQLLYQVKRTGDAAAEHILQLERNGFQVLSLADWVGQTCDHLAVSVTYGIVSKSVGLSEDIQVLQDPLAKAALAALKCFSGQTLTVFHSLPIEVFDGKVLDVATTGYLTKIVKPSDGSTEETRNLPIDALSDELVFRLGTLAPTWSWQRIYPYGEPHPILQGMNQEEQKVVILFDGFISQLNTTNWHWEVQCRTELTKTGVRCLALDLEKLWRNPSTTLHQLSQQLSGHS